ncbi:hypothetical protein ASPZODRAFT_57770 [Penicilliopsis zonata CBS 506.65]|uniref:Pre-mRNA splicing factor CLF1 n=1 Tax=Penicilliopsis zonata CBS 506.65 TaxID=1073090 RepID=A0A1L9SRE3_9EURO|nr:hypothetical protein ASPZODRAFT_57770 [Penicilliopsis zonata CBS 506.65]OJJ49661.1 hypothetical protein ASPZODRAFT_57770 [Penicilliopsis zonata CBS 506.65]
MVVPTPPFNLTGHCSVIYDEKLFVYSENGFASIPLKRNGTWSTLDTGVAVSGAACVKGALEGDGANEALYVVGGTSSSSKYSGLQRYSFSATAWETITPATEVTKDRVYHGAVYLNATASILVYAGSQEDESTASTQTFVISTTSPYTVLSYDSNGAPPATLPILLPWNGHEAALVGGFSTTDDIYLFNAFSGWQNSSMSLTSAPSSGYKSALLSSSNGSKILETFNMDVSPNTVTSVVLLNPGGTPASPGETPGASSSTRKRKRESTLSDYPAYDGTYASTTKWTEYSLAQGDDGLVVLSSGESNDSITVFNQTSNSWVNATKLFYGDEAVQQILGSTTSSASASASATATGNSTASATGSSSSSDTGTIVAATLGSVLGFAAILIVLLLFLKRVKNQRKQIGQRNGGAKNEDRLSFQDQGIEPLAKSAYPMAKTAVPVSAVSMDSLAIFSGTAGDEKPAAKSAGRGYLKNSSLSTVQSGEEMPVAGADRTIQQPSITVSPIGGGGGGRAGDRRTDEGWARYFQDHSVTNLVGAGSARDTMSSEVTKSDYRSSAWPMSNLKPLNFGFLEGPQPLGQVTTGSPTTSSVPSDRNGRSLIIPQSQSARISSASSVSILSDESEYDRRDHWLGRPPSSSYSRSYYNRDTQQMSTYDPRIPGEQYQVGAHSYGRQSSMLIPDDFDEPPRRSNINSDMSWLNLHATK